jgi:SAM-dependent methyltransferase
MEKANMQKNKSLHFIEKRNLPDERFYSDIEFNRKYPQSLQNLAKKHWTPLHIAQKAACFLAAENNVTILDVGSGVGKFCLAAARHKPNAFFFGVEQRRGLIDYAEAAREILRLDIACFIYGNFTQLDFRQYDHFYFYNAFYENLVGADKIDNSIVYSGELFNYYNRYLYRQLEQKPAGTRLVTFHSLEDEVPPGYHVVGIEIDSLLKLWIKI